MVVFCFWGKVEHGVVLAVARSAGISAAAVWGFVAIGQTVKATVKTNDLVMTFLWGEILEFWAGAYKVVAGTVEWAS